MENSNDNNIHMHLAQYLEVLMRTVIVALTKQFFFCKEKKPFISNNSENGFFLIKIKVFHAVFHALTLPPWHSYLYLTHHAEPN